MAERVTVERMDGVRGVMGIQASTAPQFQIHLRNGEEPKSESLGKQTIDGLEVEGTRSTIVIPAGQIGNERDISIVNERWYSPDLQTVVMTTNSDPRMGVTNYKLTKSGEEIRIRRCSRFRQTTHWPTRTAMSALCGKSRRNR